MKTGFKVGLINEWKSCVLSWHVKVITHNSVLEPDYIPPLLCLVWSLSAHTYTHTPVKGGKRDINMAAQKNKQVHKNT